MTKTEEKIAAKLAHELTAAPEMSEDHLLGKIEEVKKDIDQKSKVALVNALVSIRRAKKSLEKSYREMEQISQVAKAEGYKETGRNVVEAMSQIVMVLFSMDSAGKIVEKTTEMLNRAKGEI